MEKTLTRETLSLRDTTALTEESISRRRLRVWAIVFVCFFACIIFTVPLVQAGIELCQSMNEHRNDPSKPVRIQMLDLIEDSFVTPLARANAIHSLLAQVVSKCNPIESQLQSASKASDPANADLSAVKELADDQAYAVGDARRAFVTINRYVTGDTTKGPVLQFDSLANAIAAFEASIGAGTPIEAIRGEYASVENRAVALLNAYPRRTALAVPMLFGQVFRYIFWGDKYLRPYEQAMKDNSVFANAIRPAYLYMWYALTQDLGEKAVQGRHGWLFYKPDVDFLVRPYMTDLRSREVDPNDKPLRDSPVDTIVSLRDQLEARGIDLLVVIIPVKSSIYPDMLNPRMKAAPGTFTPSLRVIKELRARGVPVVDLFSAFARERANDPARGDSLYLHKDTHWKARALRLASRLVAERIKTYPWYSRDTTGRVHYVIDSVVVDRVGDIGTMTTLPRTRVHDLRMSFDPEKTMCYQVYRVDKDSTGTAVGRTLYKDDYHTSKVLLLGDSFSRIYQTDEPGSAGWISHLAYELAEPVASIVSDGGASTLVRETLARKPGLLKGKKLVVWEFVERDLRYGDEGWKDIKIYDAKKKQM